MRTNDESDGAGGTGHMQELEEDLFPHNSLSPIPHQQYYAFELKYNIHWDFKMGRAVGFYKDPLTPSNKSTSDSLVLKVTHGRKVRW